MLATTSKATVQKSTLDEYDDTVLSRPDSGLSSSHSQQTRGYGSFAKQQIGKRISDGYTMHHRQWNEPSDGTSAFVQDNEQRLPLSRTANNLRQGQGRLTRPDARAHHSSRAAYVDKEVQFNLKDRKRSSTPVYNDIEPSDSDHSLPLEQLDLDEETLPLERSSLSTKTGNFNSACSLGLQQRYGYEGKLLNTGNNGAQPWNSNLATVSTQGAPVCSTGYGRSPNRSRSCLRRRTPTVDYALGLDVDDDKNLNFCPLSRSKDNFNSEMTHREITRSTDRHAYATGADDENFDNYYRREELRHYEQRLQPEVDHRPTLDVDDRH